MDAARKREIEVVATDLQRAMWMLRKELLPQTHTPSPFDLLKPWLAAYHLGVEYVEEAALDRFGRAKVGHDVAGFIDRDRNLIAVSLDFELETRLFTGAHEVGHFLLHPHMVNLHRDRPIKGMVHVLGNQSSVEREANFFGGCFLLPRRLIDDQFRKVHGCSIEDYRFTECEAWRLCPSDSHSILKAQASARSRALALASYKSGAFQSLARTFNVSVTTMAIRLEELGLKAEWP